MTRRPVHGVDVHLDDVVARFDELTPGQKSDLILRAPALYFAVARLVRRTQVEVDR